MASPKPCAIFPVAALRLEPHQQDAARRLGIDRIGDLIAMPRAPLAKRFGASLLDRLDQATGRVAEPFDALLPFVVPEEELRFAEPIGGADGIARAMAELVAALADHLRGRGLGVRVVRLVCDRVDRQDQIITVGMARATREVAHILRLLAMKIETIDPGFGIDAMRLIAVRTEPLGASVVEGDLGGQPANADMALLIDQIITRLGTHSIYRASAIESDVPERSVGRIAAMADPTGWPDPWPRPVRLLRRPEKLDDVIALLPDQPPRRFTWRGDRPIRSSAPTAPSASMANGGSAPPRSTACATISASRTRRGAAIGCSARGDGERAVTGDLSWYLHGVFG
jgi:protein ImuB